MTIGGRSRAWREAYRFDKDWHNSEGLHISTGLLLKIHAEAKVAAPLAIQTGQNYQHQVHGRKQCICVINAGRGISVREE